MNVEQLSFFNQPGEIIDLFEKNNLRYRIPSFHNLEIDIQTMPYYFKCVVKE